MAFSRIVLPETFFVGDELTRAMAGIGMRVSCDRPMKNPNLEDVLLSASIEGLDKDWRTLSLVVDWFFKHQALINVDRLTRALIHLKSNELLIAFWSSLAKKTKNDTRFSRMKKLYSGKKILLGFNALVERNGEDERFSGTNLIVPNLMLRSRPSDILDIDQLVKINLIAYYRVMMGATYRSDIFALLKSSKKSYTVSDLARGAYSAFKTAWDSERDWKILM